MDAKGLLYIIAARAMDNPLKLLEEGDELAKFAEETGAREVLEFLREASGMDIEGHRVEMFELAPRCPPYAGYYALGEDSKERGWYMHTILTYYRALGFDMDVRRELPDYLPAMLEFLGATYGVDDLGKAAMRRDFYRRFIKPWFNRFKECVERHNSPFAHILKIVEKLFKEFEEL